MDSLNFSAMNRKRQWHGLCLVLAGLAAALLFSLLLTMTASGHEHDSCYDRVPKPTWCKTDEKNKETIYYYKSDSLPTNYSSPACEKDESLDCENPFAYHVVEFHDDRDDRAVGYFEFKANRLDARLHKLKKSDDNPPVSLSPEPSKEPPSPSPEPSIEPSSPTPSRTPDPPGRPPYSGPSDGEDEPDETPTPKPNPTPILVITPAPIETTAPPPAIPPEATPEPARPTAPPPPFPTPPDGAKEPLLPTATPDVWWSPCLLQHAGAPLNLCPSGDGWRVYYFGHDGRIRTGPYIPNQQILDCTRIHL